VEGCGPPGSGPGINNGQIRCIQDAVQPGRTVGYTYDLLGRLLTANTTGSSQFPAWGLAETYERYGNRHVQTVTAGSGLNTSYNMNPANNQITTFSYDAAGNAISEPSPAGGVETFTYDSEGCYTGFTGFGGTVSYTCDGNHLRVSEVDTYTNGNPIPVVSIRSGGQKIAEYWNGAPATSPNYEYIYGNKLIAFTDLGTLDYVLRDHLSPRLYTETNGNVIFQFSTYPFGENVEGGFVFATYWSDNVNGYDYALAREYVPTQAEFLSPDPLEGVVSDPQSWNRYAYVENDPINNSDPSGMSLFSDLIGLLEDLGGLLTGSWSSADVNNALGAEPLCYPETCAETSGGLVFATPQSVVGLGSSPSVGTGWGVFQGWGGAAGRFAGQFFQTFNTVVNLGVTGIYDTVFAGPVALLKEANDNICGSDGSVCAALPVAGVPIAVEEEIPVIEETANQLARRLGQAGEDALGITGPKTGIRIPGSGRIRFPDQLTGTTFDRE